MYPSRLEAMKTDSLVWLVGIVLVAAHVGSQLI